MSASRLSKAFGFDGSVFNHQYIGAQLEYLLVEFYRKLQVYDEKNLPSYDEMIKMWKPLVDYWIDFRDNKVPRMNGESASDDYEYNPKYFLTDILWNTMKVYCNQNMDDPVLNVLKKWGIRETSTFHKSHLPADWKKLPN